MKMSSQVSSTGSLRYLAATGSGSHSLEHHHHSHHYSEQGMEIRHARSYFISVRWTVC